MTTKPDDVMCDPVSSADKRTTPHHYELRRRTLPAFACRQIGAGWTSSRLTIPIDLSSGARVYMSNCEMSHFEVS